MDTPSYFVMDDLKRITGATEAEIKVELAELGLQARRTFTSNDVTALRALLGRARGGRRGGGGSGAKKPSLHGLGHSRENRADI